MARVVIIGAGASIDASDSRLPGATNFFRCIRNHAELSYELKSKDMRDTLTSLLPLSLDSPASLKALDKVNVEDIFTLASLKAEMDLDDKHLSRLTELIRKTIVTCSKGVKKGGHYSPFVEHMLDNRTSFISFNWDILLDEALPDYRAPGDEYGPNPASDLHSEYRRICTADASQESFFGDRPPPQQDSFVAKPAYLKLHGSIDAVVCKNQHCKNYLLPFRVPYCGSSLYCQDCYEKVAPFLVPPVQNKPIRQFHHIRRTWMLASKLIQQAEEVIVRGYSLPPTDHWSRWLLGHIWGQEARCRKLVIINPEAAFLSPKKKIKVPNMGFVERFHPWRNLSTPQIKVEAYEFYDLYVKREAIGQVD
ncbi:hypothetical protein [Nitrosospira sp. Is2]|uniref:hypothetical protein n=1 Tax=Nitrosospira sp. Is2 TaxID=3080532 RepID=UPI002953FC57|nr:hypothetical protein [Nitrosospira sp. Is2]WON74781.1 hypothetical protein R5L00_04650 [Nitrosospira sp. Is2]